MSRYPIAAVIAATAILLAFTGTARAEEPVNTGYFGDVAIKGYDPVAYFTENKAVEGSPEFTYRWLGATWMMHSGLPLVSGERLCYMFHKMAVGHAIGQEVSTDVTWHGDKAAHFVANSMSQGSVLIDDDGVVEIECDDTPGS